MLGPKLGWTPLHDAEWETTFQTEVDTFIKNPDGSEYVGQVWPGYTVFPDWFAPNAEKYWTEALRNWSNSGVEFSGIWLDMNEASSFCDGSWYVVSYIWLVGG